MTQTNKAPAKFFYNVDLPWPLAELNPNARVHWSKLAKAKKAYKTACFALVKEAGVSKWMQAGDINVSLVFVPPTRQRRDQDNLIASMKAGLDGVALALGVDDQRFKLSFEIAKDRIGGLVKMRLSMSDEPQPKQPEIVIGAAPKKKGGARPNAGRKASSLTTRTRKAAEKIIESSTPEETPLGVMVRVMTRFMREAEKQLGIKDDEEAYKSGLRLMERAKDAARDAAPYIHPRLSAIEHTGKDGKDLVPSSGVLLIPSTMSVEEWEASNKEAAK